MKPTRPAVRVERLPLSCPLAIAGWQYSNWRQTLRQSWTWVHPEKIFHMLNGLGVSKCRHQNLFLAYGDISPFCRQFLCVKPRRRMLRASEADGERQGLEVV